jgi:hypothetical protein
MNQKNSSTGKWNHRKNKTDIRLISEDHATGDHLQSIFNLNESTHPSFTT